jgi:hypothetical protein
MNKVKAFFRWLNQRLPVRARCGHWLRKSDIKHMHHRAFGQVTVCPDCYAREHSWNRGTNDD